MTPEALIAALRAILRERLALGGDEGALDTDTGLLGAGIGLDSFEVLQLVAALEERFGLTIDDDDLLPDHFRTVGTLLRFLEPRLQVTA
ncbi:MAG: acyl carrier protein [Deltaproteobacteria bacterium]|nr:acyl carrier protein [Deltaproteobacteria bacterium]